jgi:hypothetical protein
MDGRNPPVTTDPIAYIFNYSVSVCNFFKFLPMIFYVPGNFIEWQPGRTPGMKKSVFCVYAIDWPGIM